MKVSLQWLSDYVDLSGISVDEILDKITNAGLEVEEVIDQAKMFDNFIVGFVKEKKKHPNADKLSLCIVSDGKEDYKVVCGAPNVDQGQKIVFAKVGAVIPNEDFKIKKAKIRGEESFGMICSEKEIGVSDNHDGIWVLPEDMKEGTPLAEALNMNDVIIDIAITPNRPDALSHIGVARDIAAIFDRSLKLPELKLDEDKKSSTEYASIEIVDAEKCPRYVGKVVTGVKIQESPAWFKTRLTNIGLRPINNVVDVTNYVQYEIGQPLHSFDLNRVGGKKIIVRQAGADKKFTTLDSKERKLRSEDLMICDADKPVAIAGVMGGENSEVYPDTKDILIESAYFNPSSIRKTSKLLGLSTDSSYRFERGTDPENTVWAAKRAAQLIAEFSGGKIAKGEIDVYPNPVEKLNLELRFKRVDRILGIIVEPKEVVSILSKLGFVILNETDEVVKVEVPTYRPDVEREIDLIEEVARIYGYEKIPSIEKISMALEKKIDQSEFDGNLRHSLTALGFQEIVTNSLFNESVAESFGKSVSVMNPKTIEMSNLRPSLVPGMLTAISKNIKVRENNLTFFEIGKIFIKKTESKIKGFEDFEESKHLLIAITGSAAENVWYAKDDAYDIYNLKGFVDELLLNLSLDKLINDSYTKINNDIFDYGFAKFQNDTLIGEGGKVNESVLRNFDITQDVFIFDFNLDLLKDFEVPEKKFVELLKYPKVIRDLAFVLDKNVEHDLVSKTIFDGSSKLLKNIKLFDIFESDALGEGKKSLAFQLEYYDESRTLTEEDVEKDFWNAVKFVQTKLNAKLRGE